MPSVIGVVHAVCSLGIFSISHQAHAASALQREAGVIAERRHFDAHGLAGFDQQRPRRSGDLFAVDGDVYVSHKNPLIRHSPLADDFAFNVNCC